MIDNINNVVVFNINKKQDNERSEEKEKVDNKEDKQPDLNEIEIIHTKAAMKDTEERINNFSNKKYPNVQLEIQEKIKIELSQESKEKLYITPCPICQSNYFLYFPNSILKEENTNKNINVNSERNEIKPVQQTNNILRYNFPVLICEQNHQICLFCRQNPESHINNFCQENNLNYNNIISELDAIKGKIPEEKKADFVTIYNLFLSKSHKEEDKESCCTCECTWIMTSFILLLILWTCISGFLIFIVSVF